MFIVNVMDSIKDENLSVKFRSYSSALKYAVSKMIKLGNRYMHDERVFFRTPEEVDDCIKVNIYGSMYGKESIYEVLEYSEYVYADTADEYFEEIYGLTV